MKTLILDLGSHSIKTYLYDKKIKALKTTTWRILDKKPSEKYIRTNIRSAISEYKKSTARIIAVGTAAMRRNVTARKIVERVCTDFNINYQTLSQRKEAQLITKAISAPNVDHIINVGGGSIQIISKDGAELLLKFGISDLNKKFKLDSEIKERKISECIDWLLKKIKKPLGLFVYTGGEKKYLKKLNCPIYSGFCKKSDFLKIHKNLMSLTMNELEKLSPNDPKWMSGAIASNCIVIALLSRSRYKKFIPSNFNISDGIIFHHSKYTF
ncbi:MAG: hypothetical protein KA715_03280 [Xanthomonadaceae bacterium]|nr:hypothetical protein [Xanthomonadaceae bacterium]